MMPRERGQNLRTERVTNRFAVAWQQHMCDHLATTDIADCGGGADPGLEVVSDLGQMRNLLNQDLFVGMLGGSTPEDAPATRGLGLTELLQTLTDGGIDDLLAQLDRGGRGEHSVLSGHGDDRAELGTIIPVGGQGLD